MGTWVSKRACNSVLFGWCDQAWVMLETTWPIPGISIMDINKFPNTISETFPMTPKVTMDLEETTSKIKPHA